MHPDSSNSRTRAAPSACTTPPARPEKQTRRPSPTRFDGPSSCIRSAIVPNGADATDAPAAPTPRTPGPVGPQLLLQQLLRPLPILHPEKLVVAARGAHPRLIHLVRQPFASVQADLNLE